MVENAEQIEHWNSDEANHWIAHAARYDVMLGSYVPRLLAAAEVADRDRILDVGCGTGTTTLAAANAAPDGDALGIDISEPMVAHARERARASGTKNVAFDVMDAQVGDFAPASRDVMISRFGVMFFDDPVAAFANIAASLRSGARVAFVCWQDLGANEWMLVPGMAAAEHTPLPDLGEPGAPGPFALGEPSRVQSVLANAGYRDIELESVEDPLLLGGHGTVDDAVEFLRGTGMARAVFADAEPDAIERAVEAVRDVLAGYATPDGVELGAAAWLVTAVR